jgi:tetratricopeptide (TPR) repeat protein
MSRIARPTAFTLALVAAAVLALHASGDATRYDGELQYQLATVLFEETRYKEAMEAFQRAAKVTGDPALALRSRKGRVRSALRVAEFALAHTEADALRNDMPRDDEVLTLHADSLWGAGLFDESDVAYKDALALNPASSRARFGLARSLATRNRERMHRYDEAANAYTNYINLLPNRDRSDKAAWSRAQVRFLKAFEGKRPAEVDGDAAGRLHTVPFKLVKDKVVVQGRVNGGRAQDFVLDTGSEETVISRQTASRAGVAPITYTLSAGVGEVGMRGLQLGRLDSLDIGTLRIRNLPVLIKNPPLRGLPRREGESFSPLSLGMSMAIDYQRRLLTIAKDLPATEADFRLPMRIHRLAMVRGTLNSTRPAYFVIDTGGEVISISADTADTLDTRAPRRIPLKVYGTSGWDRDAFLLPGVNLNFAEIEYRNFPVVVLNLRAPSVLLGFQLGGIVGHKFLGKYRVAMDLARSELRLDEF